MIYYFLFMILFSIPIKKVKIRLKFLKFFLDIVLVKKI